MDKETYFEILKDTDTVEGRGPLKSTGIAFDSEKEARNFVISKHHKKHSTKQSNIDMYIQRTTIVIYSDLNDYEENAEQVELEKLKLNALSKLSKKEVEALKKLGI